MLPFSSTAANQIRYLLHNSEDSDFDSVVQELCQFVEYGNEGAILLLQTCLDSLNLHSGDIQNMKLTTEILSAIFRYLLDRPNFSTVFCQALRGEWMNDGFLVNLSKALNLSTSAKIAIGLALTDSENFDFRMRGQNYCIAQIEEICANPLTILSHQQIQDIFMFLHGSEGLAKHMDSFMKMLSLLQLKERSQFVLSPFLEDDLNAENSLRHLDLFYGYSDNDFDAVLAEIEREMSMADIIKELGYGCTATISHCKEMLSLFLPLDELTICKILGTIACTHIGHDDGQNVHATFCSALGINSTTDSSVLSSWNVDVLVDSIKQLAPETNWTQVMENMDHEGFLIPDEHSFFTFMSIYARACQDPFPLHVVCGSVWKNAEGQLSFLRYAVSAPPEVFTFSHSGKKLPYVESAPLPSGHGNQAWYCLDLLDVLALLSERGHASSVRTLLEYPLQLLPEVLLLGVAHINSAYNLLQYEVSSSVFPLVVRNSAKSYAIHHLWHVNPKLVLRGFVDIHSIDPESIVRILDVCQEQKILLPVLDGTPFSFSIKLAAFASRKEYINLEKWLNDNLSTYKDAFFEGCMDFLKGIIGDGINDRSLQRPGNSTNIYQETIPAFFKGLQTHSRFVSQHLCEELNKLHLTFSRANPRIQNGSASETLASDGSAEEVETEANSYFHQMFSEQLSVDTMVQTLARFKESSDRREQLIFECMIGNLFEEYKFFPKYPDRQLKIAAVLFGSLIKHQLVTHLTLGIALRCVLDALRKSIDSKMFMFGAKALEQFRDRLIEWPQYCNHILQISHLRSTNGELVSFIERALAQISSSQSESNGGSSIPLDQNRISSMQAPPENPEASESTWPLIGSSTIQTGQQLSSSLHLQQRHQAFADDRLKTSTAVTSVKLQPTGQASMVPANNDSVISQKHITSGTTTMSSSPGILRPSRGITAAGIHRQPSYSTGFGAPMNIGTLVAAAERRDTPIDAPASEIQDKILFMINNISTTNTDAKAKEFTEILNEEYYPWFAQYMVMKRASIEPNFHDLYLKFLDKVNSRSLNMEILKATYENCKVLLRSDLIKSSSEERSLLKNLGSWLGKFTIGRNQALRAREIDPKVLIVEAYERGLMIAVIPFTSKILEPCQSSLAYKPPNPWTMGILSLLTEIYNLPNLKMNLKFDIEVLFKNLSVDLKDVKPTLLLKDRLREVEGNPDFSTKDISATQATIVAEVNTVLLPTLNPVDMQADVSSTSHPGVHPNVLSQYTALHFASSALTEEEKMGALGIPDRVPSGQGLSQSSSSITNIGTHVVVNQKLNALGLHLQFQRVLPLAMEKAIQEIISPVVQRSVTIASQTTRELVLKDYAMESDESRIYNSAHLMVASLAGSLAHVTCKEPLRIAMSANLRTLLQSLSVGSELLEQAVQLVTNDNLDLGCAMIEQAATEKALQTIDGEITTSLSFRRKQRESTGSAYFDAGTYSQIPFARIPEALRPKPGRLSIAQQRVYEDFVRFPWQNQSGQSSNAVPTAQSVSATGSANSAVPHVYGPSSGQLNSGVYLTPQVAPGFSAAAQPLDLISEEMDPGSVQLPSVSSSHGVAAEAFQQTAGISTDATSFPVPPELHVVESSSSVKDLAVVVPPSPTPAAERLTTVILEPLSTGEALDKYQLLAQKLESLIVKDARDTDIQGLVAEVPEIILKCVSRDEAALAVAQKVFKGLYENATNSLHVVSHLAILSAIRDVCKLVVKELTSWVIYSDEERKFNKEITVGLIRSELLNLAEYNVHLAKLIDGGRNKTATEFAIGLVQTLVVQEPSISAELYNTIEALSKLLGRPGLPESLVQLFEIIRNISASVIAVPVISVNKEDKSRQSKEKKINPGRSNTGREDYSIAESATVDPAGFRDQVSHLFSEWFQVNDLPATDAAYTHYVSQLQQNNLLKGDERTDSFFRILTELAATHCVASEQTITPSQLSIQSPHQVQHLSFIAIDAYAKLMVLVLKYCLLDQGSSKVTLLPKILSVTVSVIQKDAEEKKSSFNPRPYFRLFVYWLWELDSSDPLLDAVSFQVLTSFANAFHALQPLKVPGLSFAWLELVSHRSFMPRLLTGNSCKGWPFFQRLLVDLFKFMEPCLRNAELGEPVRFLYKGTLRVLLVLLHDFPDFLCEYHFSLCDAIPPSCIQMRNVILSAFPPKMRLPDPSTPNLKIDLLADISHSPRILSDIDGALKAKMLKADVDEYLKTRPQGSSFLTELKQRLLLSPNEAIQAGTQYNVPLINSLVLYVGIQAIQQLQSKSPQLVPTPQMGHPGPADAVMVGAAMDIFRTLAVELDTEGRYLFLNAVANQLRYPNNHTHYFSFVLLFLFFEAKQEIIQEQITRVLLERLIVNRPHPWGLLITFIELIKNERYAFWKRSFVHSVPEISKLFESVARSCGGSKAVDDSMVAGGIPDGNL
uniref:CCR4-NOT transcription complex subunit 1 n=1 Tax=Anthurium amnicola TaxID=1678845 RepID=A0A1D1XGX4_9ARAE